MATNEYGKTKRINYRRLQKGWDGKFIDRGYAGINQKVKNKKGK